MRGWMEDRRSGGKGCGVKSSPPIGDDPEEPSATRFVYSWASFFAPVSTRRAVSRESRSFALNAIAAFKRPTVS